MRAWQFVNTWEPLFRAEVAAPVADDGQVVIDVKAAGLCHSDVGMLTDPGWRELLSYRPITIGHEVAGVISEVGAGVTEWQVGDRVGVCPTTSAGAPGYSHGGGFADKTVIGQEALVRMPDGLSFELGAMATDAGMTAYHALVANGKVAAGMKVGIIGIGGLGQIGARVAVLKGAEVYVAEINEATWEMGHELGVKQIAKDITDFAGVGLDLIVDYAGFGTTTNAAIATVRLGGTVVLVGMGKLEAVIDTKKLITNQVTLIGSNGGTPEDIEGVYDLIASGDLTPVYTVVGFEEIPEGLGQLMRHEVKGRLVAHVAD